MKKTENIIDQLKGEIKHLHFLIEVHRQTNIQLREEIEFYRKELTLRGKKEKTFGTLRVVR